MAELLAGISGFGSRTPSIFSTARSIPSSYLGFVIGNHSLGEINPCPNFADVKQTSIQFIDYALSRLPFRAEVIQTDNGSEFQGQFHWHVLDKGINHVFIRPRRPRLNGKVERSHRIDEEEFYRMLKGVVIDDTKIFNEKLREWEDFYNYQRPHSALSGMTPYERFREKAGLQV